MLPVSRHGLLVYDLRLPSVARHLRQAKDRDSRAGGKGNVRVALAVEFEGGRSGDTRAVHHLDHPTIFGPASDLQATVAVVVADHRDPLRSRGRATAFPYKLLGWFEKVRCSVVQRVR